MQPNLADPWTPLSALFVLELLTEIFKYATTEDLHIYADVCLHWEEPAQARLLETVQLDNPTQMAYLYTKPTFRRYVRNLVTCVDFDIPLHELLVPESSFFSEVPNSRCRERPMNITAWHVVGPILFQPSRFLVEGIRSFSGSLHTFHVHDSLWLDLEAFCDLLNALGNCRKLRTLALPTDLIFHHRETSEEWMVRWEETFSSRLVPSLNRPRIVQLQLVSTNSRYRLCSTRSLKATHAVWILHPSCPLSFAHTSQLIVAQGTDLQCILPVISTLESLELCCEDPRLWKDYGECPLRALCHLFLKNPMIDQLLKVPLKLPFLKSLRLGFPQMDAVSSFLRMIHTPNLETIKIRYDWLWHPFHFSFFANNLRDVVESIAKMGLQGLLPKLLNIYLEGFWPIGPPEWFQDIFNVAGIVSNIHLLLEPITLPDPVFMTAHDAIY